MVVVAAVGIVIAAIALVKMCIVAVALWTFIDKCFKYNIEKYLRLSFFIIYEVNWVLRY